MTLTARQSKIPGREMLTICTSRTGSVRGSKTGEQRCMKLRPTDVNCRAYGPSAPENRKSAAC